MVMLLWQPIKGRGELMGGCVVRLSSPQKCGYCVEEIRRRALDVRLSLAMFSLSLVDETLMCTAVFGVCVCVRRFVWLSVFSCVTCLCTLPN